VADQALVITDLVARARRGDFAFEPYFPGIEIHRLYGDEKSGPCHVAFTPDGKRAIVTRDGDHTLSMLAIDGDKVTDAKRDFTAGLRPYGVEVSQDGRLAVVANVGRNTGDVDTMSVVDLQANPPRVVDSIAIGHTPEGIALSPDGRTAALVTHNGSTKARGTPFHNAQGKVVLVRIDGLKASRLTEAPIGVYAQGATFSRDGKRLLVQNMMDRELQVFAFDGSTLTDTGQRVKLAGPPVGIRIADPKP